MAAGERLAANCPLTHELAAFIASGVSIMLAAVDRHHRPVVGIALGCLVEADGTLRIALRPAANRPVLDAVAAGSCIAATFSRPITHRSIQFKARTVRLCPAGPADVAAVTEQAGIFRDELIAVDHDEAFADSFVAHEPGELQVLSFRPETAFVQTPGPGAGAELGG